MGRRRRPAYRGWPNDLGAGTGTTSCPLGTRNISQRAVKARAAGKLADQRRARTLAPSEDKPAMSDRSEWCESLAMSSHCMALGVQAGLHLCGTEGVNYSPLLAGVVPVQDGVLVQRQQRVRVDGVGQRRGVLRGGRAGRGTPW